MRVPQSASSGTPVYPLPSSTVGGATATEADGIFFERYSTAGSANYRRGRVVIDRVILENKSGTSTPTTLVIEGVQHDGTTWTSIEEITIGVDTTYFIPTSIEMGIAVDARNDQKLIGFRAYWTTTATALAGIVYRIVD